MPLLALSAPAHAYSTGSLGVDELSPSSPERQDSEAISVAVGAGWQAPFTLTAAVGVLTSRLRPALLTATERRIAGPPD